jgi:hypothetical protein
LQHDLLIVAAQRGQRLTRIVDGLELVDCWRVLEKARPDGNGGLQQRRQLVFADEVRSEEVRADEEDCDFRPESAASISGSQRSPTSIRTSDQTSGAGRAGRVGEPGSCDRGAQPLTGLSMKLSTKRSRMASCGAWVICKVSRIELVELRRESAAYRWNAIRGVDLGLNQADRRGDA